MITTQDKVSFWLGVLSGQLEKDECTLDFLVTILKYLRNTRPAAYSKLLEALKKAEA